MQFYSNCYFLGKPKEKYNLDKFQYSVGGIKSMALEENSPGFESYSAADKPWTQAHFPDPQPVFSFIKVVPTS